MKIQQECLPCIVRQSIEAARKATDDEKLQQKIITYALEQLSKITFNETSPYMGRVVHRYIKECTGIEDPYVELKEEYNKIAEEICDTFKLKDVVSRSEHPFETACNLAIAGNIIDFSVYTYVDKKQIEATITESISNKLDNELLATFKEKIQASKKILYIGDNAGEIVFDKLLVELLPKDKTTYVVKGGPLVNDALMEDAVAVGMTELVPVIDVGCDCQGVIMDLCSQAFKKCFDEADLIISKGQANYETLSHIKDKDIFYLLKAKCQNIADHIGCPRNASVLKK